LSDVILHRIARPSFKHLAALSTSVSDHDRILNDTIRETILDLVRERGPDSSICPSEVARRLREEEWHNLMLRVRTVAAKLDAEDRIAVTQGDEPVDIQETDGPVRLSIQD